MVTTKNNKKIPASAKRVAKFLDKEYRVGRSSAGLGLFALREYSKDDEIIEYIGNKMTHEVSDEKGGKYMFRLNKKYTIDGSPRWNIARYINHACKPNAEAVIEDDKRILIQAKRKIMPGEEITYDYGKEYTEEHCNPCLCASCRS